MSTTTPDVGEIGLNVATQTVAELTLTGEHFPTAIHDATRDYLASVRQPIDLVNAYRTVAARSRPSAASPSTRVWTASRTRPAPRPPRPSTRPTGRQFARSTRWRV